jgi:signal transduction histidine kinase
MKGDLLMVKKMIAEKKSVFLWIAVLLLAGAFLLSDTTALRSVLVLAAAACLVSIYRLAGEDERVQALVKTEDDRVRRECRTACQGEVITALGKFASVASHEIKNPLASLKNISYFLNKTIKAEDDRTKRMLDMLASEIDRTNNLVTDLLDLSRAKKANRAPVNIAEFMERFLNEIKLPENVRLVRELEKTEANADPDRIRQVVINVIRNAVVAMPNGGQITVRVQKEGDNAVLTFADTGTGMDPDTLEHIYEPMFTTKTKVLGLGMTVVKEIVDMHEGTIDVSSEKGKGTTVRIALRP